MQSKEERRLARMKCSVKILQDLVKAEGIITPDYVKSNAPNDLNILGVRQELHDYLNREFEIYMESGEFEIVPEGEEIPLIEPFTHTDTRPTIKEND